ncbi:MAG: hypothetical protein WKF37_06105 [Bryobacteraceae bacterium]
MLRTAPPEAIEQAHEEAFSQLTPEQRRSALEQLASAAPAQERTASQDDPKSLARLATRTELRQPGMLERLFGGGGNRMGGFGGGMGGMFAGSLLATLAGSFIGSSIAQSFFDDNPYQEGQDGSNTETASNDLQDQGGEEAISDDSASDLDGGGFDDGGFDGGDFA